VFINSKGAQYKTALIVSPQAWGKMFISKHHYAVELSKLGYKVFFINPPKEKKIGSWCNISIEKSAFENLWILSHTLFFSSYLKFHFSWLFNRLVYIQRWIILRKTGNPDLILSFDLSNNFPLKGLKCKKIFKKFFYYNKFFDFLMNIKKKFIFDNFLNVLDAAQCL
jgi:hypothetical protein